LTQLGLALEQRENLERVSSRIAKSVLDFCRSTKWAGCDWHMEQLTRFVRADTGVAPDSPGRILRDLRQKGLINYEVVNRRQSLYRVTGVA
jgi:hypothetical protein